MIQILRPIPKTALLPFAILILRIELADEIKKIAPKVKPMLLEPGQSHTSARKTEKASA